MKDILIIDNTPKGSKIFRQLYKYDKFALVKISTLNDTKRIYTNDKFDLCIIIVNDMNKERNDILNYITTKNIKQNILEIHEEDVKCFFNRNCSFCKTYNIKSLYSPKIESVIAFIENFNESICQFVLGQNNILDHLKNISLFSKIDEQTLNKIKTISKIKHYPKDSILFYEDDTIEHFYFLLHGSVKQYSYKSNGNQIIYNQFSAPSLISILDSLKNIKFIETTELISDSIVIFIEKTKFLEIIKEDPILSFEIMQLLVSNIDSLKNMIYKNIVLETFERTALELYENPNLLQYKMKGDVANELNMASATLSRTLKTFKDLEIINERFEVIDNKKLQTFIYNSNDR